MKDYTRYKHRGFPWVTSALLAVRDAMQQAIVPGSELPRPDQFIKIRAKLSERAFMHWLGG